MMFLNGQQPIYRDIFGGGGGGSTTSTETVNNEPPDIIKPYLDKLYGMAGGLADTPSEFPPFSTVVGFAPEKEAALQGFTDRAAYGSPQTDAAKFELGKTLSGFYTGRENPNTQAMIDRVTAEVAPTVNANFSSAGRYGSGLHARALSEGLTSGIAPILYNDYATERGRQYDAIGQAPTLAAEDYKDLTALLGVGEAREGLEQRLTDEQVSRYTFPQTEPWERARMFAELITPGLRYGTQSGTTTQSQSGGGTDPVMGLLGLALGGARTAGALGWSPFG